MKKLYALLVILIVIYVSVNVSINGFNILNDDVGYEDNTNTTTVQSSDFPALANFSLTVINDSAAKYVDNVTGITIELQKIDNSQNLSNLYNTLLNQGNYTSNQVINQNGVTAYFLYIENPGSYDADIYFNKNSQNYKISGHNITYANSDYFIGHCKQLIDAIGSGTNSSTSGGSNSSSSGVIDFYT